MARAAYTYLSLGCSKTAEQRMLAFAKRQIGKPFSNYGMAVSVMWPRQTDEKTWFCAELVAAILREGGLMSSDSNPSAATPHSLYKLYSKAAAATANPFVLRKFKETALTFNTMTEKDTAAMSPPQLSIAQTAPTSAGARRHSNSPPRAAFRVIQQGSGGQSMPPIGLSFDSLRTVKPR